MAGRLILFAALLLGQGVAWGQVYRWVDDAGRVHFTDKPPQGRGEAVHIPSAQSARSPAKRPQTVPDRQRLLDMYARERAERKSAKAKAAAEQAARDRRCAKVADTLRGYRDHGLLYEERSGGRYYFSAAEKDREMAKLRVTLVAHCGGVPADLRQVSRR